ncbi:VOC family protein [Loigolactobacillus jiayinensis]|uniref:VOC family protein n=1 Tax=Loigolactobacillus jiayinensis TaxID=2486016 RepID=A0ABW1RCN6_9LACO|nr:VOC family protein [Loigolactobacillus jiayinensis]
MKISHVAVYVNDLENTREFYETYFGAQANTKYFNSHTGLATYFLSFGDQARLEIMQRPDVTEHPTQLVQGYTHLAFSVGDSAAVDALTTKLAAADYQVISGPRTTGDGYYESVVLDPEGNQIEITI